MTNEAIQGCAGGQHHLQYSLKPFKSVILIFQSGTFLMESYSTNGSKVHIDVLDEILYADDKHKENGKEYQFKGINAWCNRSTWITCDIYDLTINKKDKCCAPIGTGKLYNNPLITSNGQILF